MFTQLAVNSLVTFASIALLAVGFALIYRVGKFIHFTHGITFTAGAYFVLVAQARPGLPLVVSCIGGVLGCAMIGCLLEVSIFRPLRRVQVQPLVPLLASLGAYIALQNVVSLIFGDQTQTIRVAGANEGLDLWGARITPTQITIVCVSFVVIVLLDWLLRSTKIGRILRAVANDPDLATIQGIPKDTVVLLAFAAGSALAGLAGLLTALDVHAHPTMGMNALMLAIVAMIVGGAGNVWGISAGALLVALARQFGVWKVSSQWQDAIVFVILVLFLLLRPEGFCGRPLRKAVP